MKGLLICVIITFLFTNTFAIKNKQRDDDRFRTAVKAKTESKSELKTRLMLLKNKMDKFQKMMAKNKERARIQALSNNLIKKAESEENPEIRAKILKTAAELNEHPFKTEAKLKKEALLKEKANEILEQAEREGDLKKQMKMIKKARTIIYKLKTGHKPKFIKHLTMEAIKTASDEEIKDIAEKEESEYMALAKQAKSRGEDKKAKKFLDYVGDLVNNPKRALINHNKERKAAKDAETKIQRLLKQVSLTKDPAAKMKLLNMAKFLEKHPNKGMKMYRIKMRKKMVKKAKKMAQKLLEQARNEQNPERQKQKMIAARRLMNYPIKTLRKMKIKQMQRSYVSTIPRRCRKFVRTAFHKRLSFLDPQKIHADDIDASTVSLAAVSSSAEAYRIVHEDHLSAMMASKFNNWVKERLLAQKVKEQHLGAPHTIKDEKMAHDIKRVPMTKITAIHKKAHEILTAGESTVHDAGKPKISKLEKVALKKLTKMITKKRIEKANLRHAQFKNNLQSLHKLHKIMKNHKTKIGKKIEKTKQQLKKHENTPKDKKTKNHDEKTKNLKKKLKKMKTKLKKVKKKAKKVNKKKAKITQKLKKSPPPLPKKKAVAKVKPGKKKVASTPAPKKGPAVKPAAKKPVAAAKKVVISKPSSKKKKPKKTSIVTPKPKPAAKKPAAKKPAAKKPAAKKPAAKKPAAKKPAAKKPAAKKPAAKKPAAKKPAAKKPNPSKKKAPSKKKKPASKAKKATKKKKPTKKAPTTKKVKGKASKKTTTKPGQATPKTAPTTPKKMKALAFTSSQELQLIANQLNQQEVEALKKMIN